MLGEILTPCVYTLQAVLQETHRKQANVLLSARHRTSLIPSCYITHFIMHRRCRRAGLMENKTRQQKEEREREKARKMNGVSCAV